VNKTLLKILQKHIDDWKILKVHNNQIYQTFLFNLFKTDFTIKTEESDIQLTKPFETIQFFSQKSLQKHKDINYKYIYIGLIQVGIKSLIKEKLNTFILTILRDARFHNELYRI